MPDLLIETDKFIKNCELLTPGQKVLCAVSGGVDSMVLWNVLKELGYEVALAHVNYQLRGAESDSDEELVKREGENAGVPVFSIRADVFEVMDRHKESLQMAARRIRYDYFWTLMSAEGYWACATAHHADDQTETILMSMLRGAGFPLVKGIPVERGEIVRPLLWANGKHIEEWAEIRGIPWREDRTNSETHYLRNKIRHQVIPALEEIHPNAAARLRDFYFRYTQQIEVLRDLLVVQNCDFFKRGEGYVKIETDALRKNRGEGETEELIRMLLDDFGMPGGELPQVLELLDSETGKYFAGKNNMTVRTRDGIETRRRYPMWELDWSVQFNSLDEMLGTHYFGPGRWELSISEESGENWSPGASQDAFWMDADAMRFPVTVRKWRHGDRMQPLGMRGSRKLSDIFVDEKWSYFDKMECVVFEDAREIICLSGFRISDSVKINADTTRLVKVSPAGNK